MRRIRPFEYLEPATLGDASKFLQVSNFQPLAGGTDLCVILRRKPVEGLGFVNLKKIGALREMDIRPGGGVAIGSMVTISELLRKLPVLGQNALIDGCASLGTPGIRNLATIGGNIGRSSPASDIIPALIVLDASAEIFGPGGFRSEKLEDLQKGPGHLALKKGEFISGVRIPVPTGGSAYLKVGRIRGADSAIAGVAAHCDIRDGRFANVRIAMASVGPVTLRARDAERHLEGRRISAEILKEAGSIAAKEARPITDLRAGAEYRRALVETLCARALEKSVLMMNGE